MSKSNSTPAFQAHYSTECKNGCGYLHLPLTGKRAANDHSDKWIRCAECGAYNVAERVRVDADE